MQLPRPPLHRAGTQPSLPCHSLVSVSKGLSEPVSHAVHSGDNNLTADINSWRAAQACVLATDGIHFTIPDLILWC